MINSLEKAPLHIIKAELDNTIGPNWPGLEIETISLEYGEVLSDLLRDKISVLQIISLTPQLFYEDVMFFLYATHVINGSIADFEVVSVPTSLEVAYAVASVSSLARGTYSDAITMVVKHILTQEGYSEPLPPFNMMGVKPEDLTPGQTQKDTSDKAYALSTYLKSKNRWPQ